VKRPRRRNRALADIVELLTGFGRMLQNIDARLERVVELLGGEEDEPEDQP